jgi:GT2 family glycosyltransferase
MTVSFIIPFRDQLELLEQCLRTLVPALAGEAIEVVLVDNGSQAQELSQFVAPTELRARIIHAPIPFNFQTLCNLGAKEATGDFLFFLNSDIVFTDRSRGFLTRMLVQARRPDVGAVGNLLFYADGTIQHAGAVIGMNHYADHLYRGWTEAEAARFPFVQPRDDRVVSAVTAASLLVERRKFDEIGGFDERFIVCGGDVDLCLRLAEARYPTIYLGSVEMIHLESKSRDATRVPAQDFSESDRAYGAYLKKNGGRDPCYPAPLPLDHTAPPRRARGRAKQAAKQSLAWTRTQLRAQRERLTHQPVETALADYVGRARRKLAQKTHGLGTALNADTLAVPLARPIRVIHLPLLYPPPRLNVILPVLRERDLFGGLLTAALLAVKFKEQHPDVDLRFLLSDGPGDVATLRRALAPYVTHAIDAEVVPVFDREQQFAGVHRGDLFMATAWWTCYSARAVSPEPFVYLIQDFEPGFYAWGDTYAASLATYAMAFTPIFNTSTLQDYFAEQRILSEATLAQGVSFQPALPPHAVEKKAPKGKRTLFLYGRRSAARNAFNTAVLGLAKALALGTLQASEWQFVSAGEFHEPIRLSDRAVLRSLGKMPAEAYREFIGQVDLAVSLMLSPHPSYPPLEVAAAGALCVTNTFANKDPSRLHPNLVSCTPSIEGVADGIARALERLHDPKPTNVSNGAFPDNWDEALAPAIARLASRFASR